MTREDTHSGARRLLASDPGSEPASYNAAPPAADRLPGEPALGAQKHPLCAAPGASCCWLGGTGDSELGNPGPPRAATLCAEQSCTSHPRSRFSVSADRSVRMSCKSVGRGASAGVSRCQAGRAGPPEGQWGRRSPGSEAGGGPGSGAPSNGHSKGIRAEGPEAGVSLGPSEPNRWARGPTSARHQAAQVTEAAGLGTGAPELPAPRGPERRWVRSESTSEL